VLDAAAIILAGGSSSRMGSPKAALDWHGSTLLRRVTGLAARAVDGPVVVVRAPGQPLPELAPSVEVASDARGGRGPLEGLAAGMEAVGDRAAFAYVSSTDVPLLHPAFISTVIEAATPAVDVVLPDVGGHRQPLSAAYRLGLLPTLATLIAADRLKPAFLFERCRVLTLDAPTMLRDPRLRDRDPGLASVLNLNDPAEYRRALDLPAPEIQVRRSDARGSVPERLAVRAWTLGELAAAVGLTLHGNAAIALNGDPVVPDPWLPLARGDTVAVA
jgi:molybdopterin-guanine dinucleotide biosynthesis protein A